MLPLPPTQYPPRIPTINLLQRFIAQSQPIQRPVVVKQVLLVKMFIGGFEYAEGDAVHIPGGAHIGAVYQPVAVFFDKCMGKTRDRSNFTIARGYIGIQVWVGIK